MDSPEHRAVERACMDRGGPALEVCLAAWAATTEGLVDTLAGRVFVRRIATDAERFPVKYIFATKQNQPANRLDFRLGER